MRVARELEGAVIQSATLPMGAPQRLPSNDQDNLFGTMSRLIGLGYKLLPLGAGDDGKVPSLEHWRKARGASVETCLSRMSERQSRMYGVRLGGVLVIDCDTDNSQTRDYIEKRYGLSPVVTVSARGRHYWYRASGFIPKNVNLPELDIKIDFKSGESSYVVGPWSTRPDTGTVYRPEGQQLAELSRLPLFSPRPVLHVVSEARPSRYPVGTRDNQLFRRGISLAKTADSERHLADELCAVRDLECDEPETITDRRLQTMARSLWRHRAEHYVWSGQNSIYGMNRMVQGILDKVGRKEGDAQAAFYLYAFALSMHGHLARDFALSPDAMHKHGHLMQMGRNSIYAAARLLVRIGLLEETRPAQFGGSKQARLYRFASPARIAAISLGGLK